MKDNQHSALKVKELSYSQRIILDTYVELMDAKQFVYLNDLIAKLKNSKYNIYWSRGTEWRQDRFETDLHSLTPSYIIYEGDDSKRGPFYMPMLWNPNVWNKTVL